MKPQSMANYVRALVALLLLHCGTADAKAANISNDWTLPQEGFSVFYRFFRDKISWLEADAVCQFHHGNLVTVNNGIQFDSTRAFLRELDVLDTVWIGLKGSAGGAQGFTWANSESLDNNAGYWAESFPSTENPLCAALDPTRSFRWHALNCNGPSTSAFLCELPVPTWGSHCTVTAMPSVTIQYLSDAAAIRLSRDCGDEEGERHVLCRAGEHRATVLSQLACTNNNAHALTTEAELSATSSSSSEATVTDGLDTSTFTSSSTRSSIESAIDKIVTEIQSIATNDSLNGELEPLQKPKKQPKKFNPVEKKFKRILMDKDMRMTMVKKSDSQVEILSATTDRTDATEPLPRDKKMRVEDLKHSVDVGLKLKEERVRRETLEIPSSTDETTTTVVVAVEEAGNYTGDSALSNNVTVPEEEDFDWTGGDGDNATWINNENITAQAEVAEEVTRIITTTTGQPEPIERYATPHTTQAKGAITHPMHISSDMTKEQMHEQMEQRKNKKEKAPVNQQDHFVPPMLLVKAKFTPGKQQHLDATQDNHLTTNVIGESSLQHTIESPPVSETTNDISKFYPASTEKALGEENKVLVEIPETQNNSSAPPATTSEQVAAIELVTLVTDASPETPATTTPVVITEQVGLGQESAEVKKSQSEFTFSNIENYQPYRPNRRRSLTKPASHSYLRKILG